MTTPGDSGGTGALSINGGCDEVPNNGGAGDRPIPGIVDVGEPGVAAPGFANGVGGGGFGDAVAERGGGSECFDDAPPALVGASPAALSVAAATAPWALVVGTAGVTVFPALGGAFTAPVAVDVVAPLGDDVLASGVPFGGTTAALGAVLAATFTAPLGAVLAATFTAPLGDDVLAGFGMLAGAFTAPLVADVLAGDVLAGDMLVAVFVALLVADVLDGDALLVGDVLVAVFVALLVGDVLAGEVLVGDVLVGDAIAPLGDAPVAAFTAPLVGDVIAAADGVAPAFAALLVVDVLDAAFAAPLAGDVASGLGDVPVAAITAPPAEVVAGNLAAPGAGPAPGSVVVAALCGSPPEPELRPGFVAATFETVDTTARPADAGAAFGSGLELAVVDSLTSFASWSVCTAGVCWPSSHSRSSIASISTTEPGSFGLRGGVVTVLPR